MVELLRIAFLQGGVDLEEELEEGGAGFVLVEPGDPQSITEFSIEAEAVDDEGEEERFATAPGTYKEEVVLVVGEGTFPDSLHGVREEVASGRPRRRQVSRWKTCRTLHDGRRARVLNRNTRLLTGQEVWPILSLHGPALLKAGPP